MENKRPDLRTALANPLPALPGAEVAGQPAPLARLFRERSGFTLIEIMVVVVIIGLLLTVVATNLTKQLGTAEKVKSRADIQGLETALAQYRLDNGFYPTTEQGLEALLLKPTSEPVPAAWNGPYLKGQSAVPKDRWGNEYVYLSPGIHNPDSYDVWTRGKDGQDGGDGDAADIGNWQTAPDEGPATAAR
jgi:general secretion pathway protein G